ncbi:MAG: AAA family ATPase [Pseudomonadota bacterium]
MTAAPVIHIGGWPGSGKRTIGQTLADLCGGRLLDNHIFLDAACAVFERGTDECARLREEVRAVVLRAALKLPVQVPVILTDALSDADEDFALFKPTLDFARDRGAPLRAVVLEIDEAENLARLTHPDRGAFKLIEPAVLTDLRRRLTLLEPQGAWRLDVTSLTAEAAALRIAEKCGLTHG